MKYAKLKYESYHSYTSYEKMTTSQYKAIESGNFNNIPDFIIQGDERIELFSMGLFIPIIDSDKWIYRRSRWCEHIQTGIKCRFTTSATANYHKVNGNGSCRNILEVWFPLKNK